MSFSTQNLTEVFKVDHLFAGADEDMNDFLTFEEIIKNHELFVGSEATDYGEHLTKLHKFDDELQVEDL